MKILVEFLRLKVKEVSKILLMAIIGISVPCAGLGIVFGFIRVLMWIFKSDLPAWIILCASVGSVILVVLFLAIRIFCGWIKANWEQAKENVRNNG